MAPTFARAMVYVEVEATGELLSYQLVQALDEHNLNRRVEAVVANLRQQWCPRSEINVEWRKF